ncbi:MAG: hypothetical protein K2J70_01185 [Muribaculaceae bacterium]|nr:hypothetical protein [Muribaculaceae bacterium]
MKILYFMLPLALLVGCAKKNSAPTTDEQQIVKQSVILTGSRPASAILKASAFKMSGDYSDKVAITLNDDGTLAYFPAPSDISANSRPLDLGEGWWLNRQGLSSRSVFTRYTFEEYASLPAVPSPEELKAAVIPGARVTDFRKLDMPAYEASERLPEIKAQLGITK